MGPSGNEPSGFVFKDRGVVWLSYQGQTAFVWTIKKKNDETVHPRSKLENKVRRLPCEGYPALTSSRSEKPD